MAILNQNLVHYLFSMDVASQIIHNTSDKLKNTNKIRNILTLHDPEKLVHAFITCRWDYCVVLLDGCPAASLNKLQLVSKGCGIIAFKESKVLFLCRSLSSYTG